MCLKDRQLLDSHYLPKRAYAMNMARSLKNPNPVSIAHGMAMQISDQLRGPTFCEECERRFSVNGEQWVLAKLPKDYEEPFPLKDALVTEMPFFTGHNIKVYAGRNISGFDMDKLIYFGMSIFWRGAARQWRSSKGAIAPPVDLGEYFERSRKFLLGGPFPDDVFLSVSVYEANESPARCSRWWKPKIGSARSSIGSILMGLDSGSRWDQTGDLKFQSVLSITHWVQSLLTQVLMQWW